MPPTVGAHARLETTPGRNFGSSPGRTRIRQRADFGERHQRYARDTVAIEPTRTTCCSTPAIAPCAFALSVALLRSRRRRRRRRRRAARRARLAAARGPPRRAARGVRVDRAASAVLGGVGALGPAARADRALYALASGGAVPCPLAAHPGLVAALLAVHVAASGLDEGRFPGAELLFGVLLWGGAWLAGDRARLRRERMAELEERALRAEREAERERRLAAAEERARIARDLHDSAGHAINVILVHAGPGRLRRDERPRRARAALETIEEVARETVGEIDQLVRRPARRHGERAREVEPPPGLAALDALVERHRAAGLDVDRHGRRRAPPAPAGRRQRRLPDPAGGAHQRRPPRRGHAPRSAVAFGRARSSSRSPTRCPRGAARPVGGGHGLIGMRERAAALGGSLEAGMRDGPFRVHARLPLARARNMTERPSAC